MAEESLRSCIRAMNEWAAQEDGLPDTAADAVEEALSALSLLASEPAKGACADCGGCGGLGWIPAGDEQWGCVDCNGTGHAPAPPSTAPAAELKRRHPGHDRIGELESLLRECNAVCLCGCPESEHESYGEDGESCGHDDHECLRVPKAVLAYVERLRSAPPPPSDAVREAAEDVVCDDWWGHYCPCCGSTFKHGPECLIGRLAEAIAEARAARGGE